MSYATRPFRAAQRRSVATAADPGGIDRVFAHTTRDLDPTFRRAHARVLAEPTGAGFWLWKPYLVERHLRELAAGEWLFYCDAGVHFVGPVAPLVRHAEDHGLDVMVFELAPPFVERDWTKRDAFLLLDCDRPEIRDTPQRIGGYSLWRRSDAALDLAAAWLEAACDPRLLTDARSESGPEQSGFREHRRDQSLLSLLTKSRGIPAWRDPSQYGNERMGDDPAGRYPQVLEITGFRTPAFTTRLALTAKRRARVARARISGKP